MKQYTVTFLPEEITIEIEAGITIAEAAQQAGINLKMSCGGEGTCGKCAVTVTVKGSGKQETVLACKTKITDNLIVDIPLSARLGKHQILLSSEATSIPSNFKFEPLCQTHNVKLTPPSINENASDLSRLSCELGKTIKGSSINFNLALLRQMAATLRSADWDVNATLLAQQGAYDVIDLQPKQQAKNIGGLAIDIGTTTVAACLVDLSNGNVLSKSGAYNKQAVYGDDIISRIIHCQSANGLSQLQQLVVQNITELTEQLLIASRIKSADIQAITVAGNTTMTHLFLGLDPKYIRLDPYIPTATQYPIVKGKELGLVKTPEANVYCLPSVGSYVGGDIVAGVLYSGINRSEELILFIDIGTNGEIVLGNKDWMISCACSAGPAFEGSGISSGMRAMQGAIERVEIDPADFEVRYHTIEGTKPLGICGSGLIDCLATMHHVGLIDRAGRFGDLQQQTKRLRETDEGKEFVLAWEGETATNRDITITEGDIQNLIRAKGAIFAGIQCLLKTMQLDFSVLDKIYIAGGFGNYLNINDAIEIGLLPDLPRDIYKFVGNTSLKGANLALVSLAALEEAAEIGKKMTYLELSAGNRFMEEFISALFIPHTDLSLFPSLEASSNL